MRNRSRAFLAPALAVAAAAVALTAVAAPTASANTSTRLVFQESFGGSTWPAAEQACQTAGQQLVSQGKFDRFTCAPQLNPLTIVVVLDGYID
jgi:hypothetical protein